MPLALEDVELLPLVPSGLVDERADRLAQAGVTLELQGDEVAGTLQADRRRLARADRPFAR